MNTELKPRYEFCELPENFQISIGQIDRDLFSIKEKTPRTKKDYIEVGDIVKYIDYSDVYHKKTVVAKVIHLADNCTRLQWPTTDKINANSFPPRFDTQKGWNVFVSDVVDILSAEEAQQYDEPNSFISDFEKDTVTVLKCSEIKKPRI